MMSPAPTQARDIISEITLQYLGITSRPWGECRNSSAKPAPFRKREARENARSPDQGICHFKGWWTFPIIGQYPEGGVMRKHRPSGYTAQNRLYNNLFIRQWSPDQGICHLNNWWTLQNVPCRRAISRGWSHAKAPPKRIYSLERIYSCDNGPQTKESAILTISGLCAKFSLSSGNIRKVVSCKSTTQANILL